MRVLPSLLTITSILYRVCLKRSTMAAFQWALASIPSVSVVQAAESCGPDESLDEHGSCHKKTEDVYASSIDDDIELGFNDDQLDNDLDRNLDAGILSDNSK